jgi:hypothetical protein
VGSEDPPSRVRRRVGGQQGPSVHVRRRGGGSENPPPSRVRETEGWATRALRPALDGGVVGNEDRLMRDGGVVGSEDSPPSRVRETEGWATRALRLALDGGVMVGRPGTILRLALDGGMVGSEGRGGQQKPVSHALHRGGQRKPSVSRLRDGGWWVARIVVGSKNLRLSFER